MSGEELLKLPFLWTVPSASGAVEDRPGTDEENDRFARDFVREAFRRGGRTLTLTD